jgi:hypothetical protein
MSHLLVVNVIHDLSGIGSAVRDLEVGLDPIHQVIFKSAFNNLVEDIW